jgi:hypothetical protein
MSAAPALPACLATASSDKASGSPAFRPGFSSRSHHLTRIGSRNDKGKTIMLKTLRISRVATLVALNEALAQTSPGATRPHGVVQLEC